MYVFYAELMEHLKKMVCSPLLLAFRGILVFLFLYVFLGKLTECWRT